VNVPYSWLSEFLPGLPPVGETADVLSSIGLAAEAVHDYPGAPSGVVVARITELEPIEGSEQLQKAVIDAGGESWQVATGAPDVRTGMLVAFAPPGTWLPGLPDAIAVRVMAGIESQGMLCSARELGLFDHAAGLLELPHECEPGQQLSELWPADSIIELELTPNRADAFSILGVARDLAAKLGLELQLPFSLDLPAAVEGSAAGVSIEVSDPEASPLFTLRRITDLKVKPSPVWLQRRLAMLGLRPRNNVIDVTNYVNFELGQPSHAYDLRALEGGNMQVRRARDGEPLVTLNDDELSLSSSDLVIGTGGRAIGLAGVIGGQSDSVRPDTTEVALEVAHFEPVTVRRTARRYGLHTDAHYRFERGVDPNLPFRASARISDLLASLAGGQPAAEVAYRGSEQEPSAVAFRPERVAFLTGVEVDPDEQERLLSALGCSVDRGTHPWQVTVPSWRFDLAIEEDLIEEIIRLYGFEHIEATRPHLDFTPPQTDPTHRRLRAALAAGGFQELISYVFTSDGELERNRAPGATVRLSDPQGQERSVLRTALFPSLLAAAANNRDRSRLALFEIGHVFLEQETERLALLLTGDWLRSDWQRSVVSTDAFVLKGILERLANSLGASLELSNREHPPLHPGVSATVRWNGREIGFLGQLHPEIAARHELPDTFIAELDLPLDGQPLRFSEPGRQERVERDLALITGRDVSFSQLRQLLAPVAGEFLESLVPFDVYRGERIGEGRQSIALRFTFRHPERALTDTEVNSVMTDVISTAEGAGYDVRDR